MFLLNKQVTRGPLSSLDLILKVDYGENYIMHNSVPTEHTNTMANKVTATNVSDSFKSQSKERFKKTKIIYSDSSSANMSIGYVPRLKQ